MILTFNKLINKFIKPEGFTVKYVFMLSTRYSSELTKCTTSLSFTPANLYYTNYSTRLRPPSSTISIQGVPFIALLILVFIYTFTCKL